jgi:filamentous hemagglutinin
MNKLCYRIVFNKARGMCMAVQETARSRTKAPGQSVAAGAEPASTRLPALRRMAFLFGTGLGGMVLADAALAQIIADPRTPGQQQATVLNTANGVLQVNIQTPSAAGVSRNVYSQFDVPKSGAILNNSRTNVQTQLGGWVQGNPWLAKGTARVILNEVNSSNPSHLQGYVEVAGDRAETVIANPAGIVVDGGGFINVSRATLTSGVPMLEDGQLKGYSVQHGQILINGAGLDASKTDYTALIARSLQINAGLWAQRLNVIAGVNQVEEAAQATVTQTGQPSDAPPLFAIDVARLGGMYANHIYLVGTEAGVGVRNAGTMGASAGELVVTANGRLENSGTLQAEGTLTLTTGSLINAGQIVSGAEARIAVLGDIDNGGGYIQAPRIDLTAATVRNAQGTIAQSGASTLAIDASQTVNTGGVLGEVDASPTTEDSGTKPTPDSGAGSGGSGLGTPPVVPQQGTDAPTSSAPPPVLADGQLKAQMVDNTAGLITANGGLAVHTGALDNHNGHAYVNSLSVTGPFVENTGGDMMVLRSLDAHADSFVNDHGKLLVGGAVSGTFGSFSNRQGLLQLGSLTADVMGQMDNSGGTLRQLGSDTAVLNIGGQMAMDKGTLESAAAVNLRAGTISGSDSVVNVLGDLSVDSGATSTAHGRWTIGGAASIHSSSLDNSGGVISVARALNVATGSLDNVGGTMAAGIDLAVTASATIDNSSGTIQASRDAVLKTSGVVLNHGGDIEALSGASTLRVTGTTIDNGDGRIANAGTGAITLAADSILNGGQIGGNGSVGITARTLNNAIAGSVASQGNLDMELFDKLENAGQIASGGDLRLGTGTAALNNHGTLVAQGNIEIAAASVDNTSGTIATAAGGHGQVSLAAGSLENGEGLIQADGAAVLEVRGSVGNEAGHIAAGGQLTLNAGDRIENRSGVIETSGRMLVHGGEIGNDRGVIRAAGQGASVIEADRSIDNNGLIGANASLMVRATTLNNSHAGTVSATGDLELAVSGLLSNSGGTISTAGALNFDQAQAELTNSGVIAAAGGVHLNVDQIDNRGGRLMAGGDATVQVRGDIDNAGGVIQAAGSLNAKLNGVLRNQGGAIESLGQHGTLALGASAIDNTGGRIVNAGDGATNVSAATSIVTSGLIAGNGDVKVVAGSMDNSGVLSSSGHMELAVSSTLNNSGAIRGATGLHADQANASVRNSGVIVAGGELDLSVGSLDNSAGQIGTADGSNANVLVSAKHFGNRGGRVMANRDVTISVKDEFDSRNGLVQAKGQLQLSAGGMVDVSGGSIETLSADSTLYLHAGALLNEAGRIVNVGSGDTRVSADNDLTNSGQIAGNGALGVEGRTVLNQADGGIVAGAALSLHAHVSLDNAGTISSQGTLTMDEAGAALVNRGTIVANADMTLRANTIDNDGGILATASGSNANLSLLGAGLLNRDGTIVAERNMAVHIDGALDNSQGRIAGVAAVQVASGGAVTNDGGIIEATDGHATLALQALAIHNSGGRIVDVGQGGMAVSVTDRLDNDGLIASNGTLDLHADVLVNGAHGTLASSGPMSTAAGSLFDNAGTVSSGASLGVSAGTANVRNSGVVVANGALSLVSATFDNSHGTLQAAGSLGINATGAVSNDAGAIETLASNAQLGIHAGALDNGSGRVVNVGSGATSIAVDDKLSSRGLIAGNGSLDLSVAELENQIDGNVGAGASLHIAATRALGNAGSISAHDGLRVDAANASFTNIGQVAVGKTAVIDAASFDNGGGQLATIKDQGGDIVLRADTVTNADGVIAADGAVQITAAGAVDNHQGTLHANAALTIGAAGSLGNQGGLIEAVASGATLDLHASSVDNSAGRIANVGSGATGIVVTNSIVNSGTLAGNGTVDLNAAAVENQTGGTIAAGASLDLHVSDHLDNAGKISANGTLAMDQAAARIANSGQMAANGSITLHGAAIVNDGGQIGTLSGADIALSSESTLSNRGGVIAAAGNATLDTGGTYDNSQGKVQTPGRLQITVNGGLVNASGALEAVGATSTLDLVAASIDDTAGRIVNAGTGQTNIVSSTGIVNSGTIASNGALTLSALSLRNASGGAIGSAADLELGVREQLSNAGSISSRGRLHFDQAEASLNNSGDMGAGGAIDIAAVTVNNSGQLYTVTHLGSAINLRTAGLDNSGGTVSADGMLGVQVSGNVSNQGGTLHGGADTALDVGGTLANGSGTVESVSGTLTVQAQSIGSSGRIINAGAGQTTIAGTTGITNSGIIAGNGALDLHATGLQNLTGSQIASGGSLLLDLPQQLTNAGTISSGGTLRFEQAGATFANSGQIAAADDIGITAASFDNSGGRISTVRGSGSGITVTAPALKNRSGAIVADGDAILSFATNVDNDAGTLQAGRNLSLTTSGTISNDGGTIAAQGSASTLTISGSAIDNGNGNISNAGSGDTRLLGQISISNAGTIIGMGNVLLSAQSLSNLASSEVASGTNLDLAITRQLSNQGKINSGGTLNFVQSSATFTNSGQVLSGGYAVINASVVNNDGGQLGTFSGSGASLTLTTPQLSNQGGRIATDADLTVNTHAVAAMGELFGGRDLALTMDGDYVQSGDQQFHANRNLSLAVTGNITNTSTFQAGGTLTLAGQQISNQAGASIQGTNVALRARGDLTNTGEIDSTGTLDISAANVSNSGGIVGGNVTIAADNLDNSGSVALIGATAALGLGVDGTLNNTGGATLYSSGDMAIGGRTTARADTVNNQSSTIEAARDLAIAANTLSNVRENVQIVKVKTVDDTVHMTMPSWYQYGDNHNSFETSAANYSPHEVYFVSPSDILDDQAYVTPDGYTIHRAVIRTHANDSAFYVAASGLYAAYGAQSRLTLSDGTRVIYYTDRAQVPNPDQGAPGSNAIIDANTVTNWTSTVSFSNQYGNCSSDCIRLVTQPDYTNPSTTILRDTMRALAPVKEQLEASRDAHYAAVEDQLAPGAGASAQILSGGNMHLTVATALDNQFGDIKARGVLVFDGGGTKHNSGATLYRTYTFDGTWTTYGGQTVAYQQPSISEAIGSAAGVIDGEQGVSISGQSFSNVDVTAGTVGNIRDAVHVIGGGASGANVAGADVVTAAGVGATAGGLATGGASGADVSLNGAVASSSGAGAPAALGAAVSSVDNQLYASAHATGSGSVNDRVISGNVVGSGAINGLITNGDVHASGTSNDASLTRAVATSRNRTLLGNVSTGAGRSITQQTSAVQGADLGNATKVTASGLFILNPDTNGSYVFETRPQFANERQWTSSDYLLNQLAKDPTVTQKRLGDGFYEQQMVREQLAELTGHVPDSGASDDEVYKQLLTNAVSFAQEFGLRPGVSLSAEQVSHLTSDIVWMESETVLRPDGSTETVLAPKVYLAHVGKENLQPGGAFVTGKDVQINTTQDIVNTGGVIDGGKGRTLLMAGQDIVNRGGTIKGDSVALAARRDVKNESLAVTQTYDFKQNSGSYTSLSNQAIITSAGTLDIQAGRDLSDLAGKISAGSATLTAGQNISFGTIQTGSTYQSQIGGYTEKDSSITHQLSQISTAGDLKIGATGDLNLAGTKISIGATGSGSGQLLAGGTINIAAVTNEVNTSVQNDPGSQKYDKQIHANQTMVGADVAASGGLTLGAGLIKNGAINITASSLTAGDALQLSATDGVNIVSAQESHLSDTALTRSSSSFMKSNTTQRSDYVASSQAVGSTLSGKTVDINAGKDISVLGSAIAGDGDVNLAATGSVNIGASTSTVTEQHHLQVKESGFLSGNGFGFSYGTRTTTTDQSRDATTQSGQSRSMVGSLGGNLNITAGDAIRVSGSDLMAGTDMNLAGRSVTIDPGQDNSKGKFERTTVQDGLTLAVGGSVVNAIQTFQSMSSAASQTKDSRVRAMAAATAAMAAKNVANDFAQNGVNVSVSLTVGHSESQYTQNTSDLLNSGSALKAGKDITIRATGGKDGNINVIGSDLNAQGNITLKADNQVNLLAAQDLESQHSTSKSMSAGAGVGASFGSNGMSVGFTANASLRRGSEDGEGTTQLNTYVDAGQQLSITSGGDTNLKGAVASGNQIVADVKGNLNIESLQDKATFDSKNEGVSVSGTVGVGFSASGSVNQSKVHNDYASVQEQSGFRAGDGGFQVTVGGNTGLKGGVISSSTTGATSSSLVTGALTYSDIANKAESSGSSIGMGGGFSVAGKVDNPHGKEPGGVRLVDMGPSGAGASLPSATAISSNESSTTRSGIGSGSIVIMDNAAQRDLTGQSAAQAAAGINRNVVTGSDTSGRIGNSFNPNALQATLQITSVFTAAAAPLAANAVGDIGKAKQDAAQRQADAYAQFATDAATSGDTETAQVLKAKSIEFQTVADSWGDNGSNRSTLHAISQGLIGGLASGSSGAISNASGVVGGNLGQQLGQKLGEDEAERAGLQGQARNDLVNRYQNTLASVGGAVVGLAASTLSGAVAQSGLIGAAQAANTANAVDSFNRQLHPEEKKRIKQLANGDPVKEARLTEAACALVKCYAEFPTDSDAYRTLKKLAEIGASPAFSAEREQLVQQQDLFNYTTTGVFSDKNLDAARQFNNTYQVGTRTLGAGQAILGGVGVAASVATAPVSCATGIGCAVNAGVATLSLDAAYAGAKQVVSGVPELTQFNKGLQTLGLSPEAAAWTEAAIGISAAAKTASIANRAIDETIALRKISEVTYIPQGARPDPITYLSKEQIESHLANFDKGASYLVPKNVLDTYGRDLLGYPDNSQFVMPKEQMDQLLMKANGNIAIIEKELGIPAGAWSGKEMVRVDVPDPRSLNLRMPSGNEAGTNSLWIPGGKLPTGRLEAIVNQIPEGQYIERSLWAPKK